MRLYCEIGKHYYEKEGRGRPSKNCPIHRPAKQEIKIHTTAILGANRAESSKSILDTIPGLREQLEQPDTIVLRCEAPGAEHEYTAARRRGRKPRYCPEHSAELFSSPSAPNPAASLSESKGERIKSIRERYPDCICSFDSNSTPAEIRALGGGCKEPNYVCNCLDAVRRELSL